MYALVVHDAAKLRAENARLKSKLAGPASKAPGSGSITRFGQASLLRVPREAPSPAASSSSSAASKPLSMRVVGSSGPTSKSIFKKQPWLKVLISHRIVSALEAHPLGFKQGTASWPVDQTSAHKRCEGERGAQSRRKHTHGPRISFQAGFGCGGGIGDGGGKLIVF
eukprot:856220-Prymnesium_polylepis.1